MGVCYLLINKTKKELISFNHIPASKAREIAGNPVSASITSWYLLNNLNDEITFLPDEYFEKSDTEWTVIKKYRDVTDEIVNDLIKNKLLIDEGIEMIFGPDEPDLYFRKLKNIWMDT